jgi:cell division protein ZapE
MECMTWHDIPEFRQARAAVALQARQAAMLEEAQVLQALSARGIAPDATQRVAIAAMLELLASRPARKWQSADAELLGVYCHGLPGRGKSLVMDTVYSLAPCAKQRVHFHEFLRGIIRRQMGSPAGGADSLVENARAWLGGIELLCFDEFHVHDIADAFLIGRFLDTALALGIRVVATSNYPPDGLLPDPLYHSRFQPTIDRLNRHFNVIHFEGAQDYRFVSRPAAMERFLAPLGEATDARLLAVYKRCERASAQSGMPGHPATLQVAGRTLQARAAGEVALWADFDELCVASRSHLDYLELAERWQALLIDRLSIAQLAAPSTLQRLIWLVDIFYDRKLTLFIASDLTLVDALNGLEGAHDLSRTLSRLAEMQSADYGIVAQAGC